MKGTQPELLFIDVKARFLEFFFTKIRSQKTSSLITEGGKATFFVCSRDALGEIGVSPIKCPQARYDFSITKKQAENILTSSAIHLPEWYEAYETADAKGKPKVVEKFILNLRVTATSFNGFIFIEHTAHGSIMNQLAQQFDRGQIGEDGLHLEFRVVN
jgi:hypothetical protein